MPPGRASPGEGPEDPTVRTMHAKFNCQYSHTQRHTPRIGDTLSSQSTDCPRRPPSTAGPGRKLVHTPNPTSEEHILADLAPCTIFLSSTPPPRPSDRLTNPAAWAVTSIKHTPGNPDAPRARAHKPPFPQNTHLCPLVPSSWRPAAATPSLPRQPQGHWA